MPKKFLLPGNANPGVLIAYLLTFSAILFTGTVAYFNTQEQENAAREITRIQHLGDLIDQTESAVVDAESGQRGYLLTGRDEYLDPYQEATGQTASLSGRLSVAILLGHLAAATSADAPFQQELPALEKLIREKLDELDQTISLRRAGRNADALALVMSDEGKRKMDQIRGVLAQMRFATNEKLSDLEKQRSAASTQAYATRGIAFLLLILALFILAVTRHRANKQLARAQARLAHFVESDLVGIALCGMEGTVLQANNEYLRIIGYSREDLVQGRVNWDAFTPPEWLSVCREHLEEARESGFCRHYESEILRKDGKRTPVMLGFVYTDDKRSEAVTFMLDITEHKRSQALLHIQEEELQRANRRKDEFIALLAHELRNPLAPIQTGLDLLKMSPVASGSVTNTLAIMDRQLSHLVRLIDDLLDVSRITAGKLELRMERIAAAEVVHAALEASAPLVAASKQTIDLDMPDADIFLCADTVRMTQVLNNLLSNAVRYSPKGSCIRLVLRCEGEMAVFEVADRGIGIEAEMQPKVFDMFAQTEHGCGMRKGGLGLGLPPARQLVEMHGGRIDLHSARGEGSRFIVSIPAQPDGAPPPDARAGSTPADAPPQRSAQRILVLDDNVDAAMTLGALLGARGHEIGYAHCGTDAIALASAFQPEIAFLDIGLPDMSGYDVARALRGMPALARTKLVALTGWGAARDKESSRNAGIDVHLTKPARLEQILALIPELG